VIIDATYVTKVSLNACNWSISQGTVTGTLSLDGESADTRSFADKTLQLLYAAAPTMGDNGKTDDNELLIALRHPLRRQILRSMVEHDPISPREISNELREPLSNVSYHVRVLADCGAAALVDTTPVRGSMQHFYSPTIHEPWAFAVLGLSENGKPTEGGENEEPAP
jgi:DNA-binding transcriptional ArsR family regulator